MFPNQNDFKNFGQFMISKFFAPINLLQKHDPRDAKERPQLLRRSLAHPTLARQNL
jgi:hypothetical protein